MLHRTIAYSSETLFEMHLRMRIQRYNSEGYLYCSVYSIIYLYTSWIYIHYVYNNHAVLYCNAHVYIDIIVDIEVITVGGNLV